MPSENDISNYLPLNRKFFEHFLWEEERVFSKSEAWLDLIQSASWNDDSRYINHRLVKWGRGERPVSVRFMAKRWKWSKDRVMRFFKILQDDGMITTRTDDDTSITILTLCNYESYNLKPKSTGTRSRTVNVKNKDSGKEGDKEQENKLNELNKEREGFENWMTKFAPRVNQMSQPLTYEQYSKLRKDYAGEVGKEMIKKILLAMQNRKDLLTKYVSANLTARNWLSKEDKPVNGSTHSGSNLSAINEQIQQKSQNGSH